MLKVEIPNSLDKLTQQIEALKYLIANDTNDKDREIHKQALADLEAVRNEKAMGVQ